MKQEGMVLPFVSRSSTKKEELLHHVIITGGSSGIGLAVAKSCLAKSNNNGGKVVLLARKKGQLEKAKEELLSVGVASSSNDTATNDDRIILLSADVTDYETLTTLASHHVQTHGPPTMIFNVAGTSSAKSFDKTEPTEFHHLMNVNYFGTVNVTKAFLPHMQRAKTGGAVLFTSSAAGQLGIYGYSAYSASKYALRGLAEALTMELYPENISVTVAYPPDTDTPGYKAETEAGKPRECQLISESAGFFKAEDVGDKMVDAALAGREGVYWGLEGWMLYQLTAGMGPVNGVLDAITQICLMGILRLISLFYLWDFRRIVAKCRREREEQDEKKED